MFCISYKDNFVPKTTYKNQREKKSEEKLLGVGTEHFKEEDKKDNNGKKIKSNEKCRIVHEVSAPK